MGSVVQFKPKPTTDEYFGGCPHCGQNDGNLNIGREHWFRCDRHKTKWCVGENLFSAWRDEDEGVWTQNRFKLAEYMTVEPIRPTAEARARPRWYESEPIDKESMPKLAIKFNNCGAEASCALCGAIAVPPVGPAMFIQGGFDWVCDECSNKHAPNLRLMLVRYWAAGNFTATAGCSRCGRPVDGVHHRLCGYDTGPSPAIDDAQMRSVIDWMDEEGIDIPWGAFDDDVPF